MARAVDPVIAEELELSDNDLSALEDMDDLLDEDDDDDALEDNPVASLDDDDDDDEQEEADAIDYRCPVCGAARESEEEIEFHLTKRHPDYEPPAEEPEEVEEVEDPADVLEEVLDTPAPEPEPMPAPRGKRSRRTKAEIAATKADVERQREAEKANTKEPPEAARQEREYLTEVMNRADDDEVARARREAIERLKTHTPGGKMLSMDTDSRDLPDAPQDGDVLTLGSDGTSHYGYAYNAADGAQPLLAMAQAQPWVEVKVSVSGTLGQVSDFLRALAIAADGAGVAVSSGTS